MKCKVCERDFPQSDLHISRKYGARCHDCRGKCVQCKQPVRPRQVPVTTEIVSIESLRDDAERQERVIYPSFCATCRASARKDADDAYPLASECTGPDCGCVSVCTGEEYDFATVELVDDDFRDRPDRPKRFGGTIRFAGLDGLPDDVSADWLEQIGREQLVS